MKPNDSCNYRDMIISNNESMKHMQKDIDEIKSELKEFIKAADKKYASKADLIFWRGAIVSLISTVIVLVVAEVISVIYK